MCHLLTVTSQSALLAWRFNTLTLLSECWIDTRETETRCYLQSPVFGSCHIVSHFLTPFSPISLGRFRRAVRPAQLVACPWLGYDQAQSPTGPTSTPPPLAPPPPPPPPHIARPSAVPPPTTGSDDTATSVSLFSNFIIPLNELYVYRNTSFHLKWKSLVSWWIMGKKNIKTCCQELLR